MNRKNHPTDQTSQGTILKQRMRVALFWTLVIQGSVCVAQVPGLLSYQGRVAVGAANFEGSGQFKFALVNSNAATSYWSNDGSSSAGSQPTTAVALTVTKGLYSVLLGDTNIAHMTVAVPFTAFTNSDVRLRVWFNDGTNGSQMLAPDQRLGGVGYALVAASVPGGSIGSNSIAAGSVGTTQLAAGAVTAAKIATNQVVKSLDGLTDAVTLLPGANVSLTTNANTLTISAAAANAWGLSGNAGTIPGTNFVGTTDNKALELRVNGQRGLRIEPSTNGAPNVIGGSPVNFVSPGIDGATIAGGGSIADALTNKVTYTYGTIGGGAGNTAGDEDTVGGGTVNSAIGGDSTVSGGDQNSATGGSSTIGGGYYNVASGGGAVIGGGGYNTVSGDTSTVGGGYENTVSGNSSTVAGGSGNSATNDDATVGGGLLNQALGLRSTVGGGIQNVAKNDSSTVSGGYLNMAGGQGDFVGGGNANSTSNSYYAVIAGGQANRATNYYGTVVGGYGNSSIGGGSFIGGGSGNVAGSSGTTVGGGSGNVATNFNGTVAGGANNVAGGSYSSVGGGQGNIDMSFSSTVGGGVNNLIEPNTDESTIAGGQQNTIHAGATTSAIGGGTGNTIQTNAYLSTIAGGYANVIGTNSTFSMIAGGDANTILSNSTYTTIGGGQFNTASGNAATIPGGAQNLATGWFSFAAGLNAQATNNGAFVWADLSGTPFASTVDNQFSVRASGGVRFVTGGRGVSIDGSSVGGTNQPWLLRGNSGASPSTNFLGTTDNQPLEFRAFNQRALRLEPNTNGSPNMIGGSAANYVSNAVIGAAIGGGGATNFNGIRFSNSVIASFGTVSGGIQNLASGFAATVGGGEVNAASGPLDPVVGGGNNNTASGSWATVSGGKQNTASGLYSAVSGGYGNLASGNYSFAAGQSAQALHSGSFVWSDASAGTFASTTANQFSVRAAGGIVLAADVLLSGGADYHNISMSGGNALGYLFGSYNPPTSLGDGIHLCYNWYADAGGVGHVFNSGGATSRITAGYGEIVLAVGGMNSAPLTTMLHVTTSGVCVNGTVSNCSDRNVKQDVAAISPAQILDRVLSLPVTEWSYKFDSATRHIGPMAQDFYSAFNVGQDEKHITSIDEGGVALAAIQGLNEKVDEKEAKIQEQDSKIRSQSSEIAELKQRLAALEALVRHEAAR